MRTLPVILLSLAVPAAAVDLPKWDTNDDQAIDKDEFVAGMTEEGYFDEYDIDSNEELDLEEMKNVSYAAMDVDNDGEVTVPEWNIWVDEKKGSAYQDLPVEEWDDNDDGLISKDEYLQEVRQQDLVAAAEPPVDEEEFLDGFFNELDEDDDGLLTEDEFTVEGLGG